MRGLVLNELLHGDEEYRAHFMRRFADMLNHLVTPRYLQERYDHYAFLVRRFHIPHRAYLRDLRAFLAARPAILWAHAAAELGTGEALPLRIAAMQLDQEA